MLKRVMDSPWDGRDRRRGQSREALREHLRQLREAWEAVQRDARLDLELEPDSDNEKPTLGVQGDNDEERGARVDAMLETLRPSGKRAQKAVVRRKTLSTHRVSRKR